MVTKEKLLALIEEDALEDVMDVLGEWENLSKSNREKLSILKGRLAKDNNARFEGTHTSDTERNAIRKESLRFVHDLFKAPIATKDVGGESRTISTLERVFYWAAIIGLIGFGYYLWTGVETNREKIISLEEKDRANYISLSELSQTDSISPEKGGKVLLTDGILKTIKGIDLQILPEVSDITPEGAITLKFRGQGEETVYPVFNLKNDADLLTSLIEIDRSYPDSVPIYPIINIFPLNQFFLFLQKGREPTFTIWEVRVQFVKSLGADLPLSTEIEFERLTKAASRDYLDSIFNLPRFNQYDYSPWP
ncbi:MAG: hypothetical protein AAFW00_21970 [Bacteroidota bacterium]